MSRQALTAVTVIWALTALGTAAGPAAAQDVGIGPAPEAAEEGPELKLDPESPGPESIPLPDLVAKFDWREGLRPGPEGYVRLPVTIGVANQGNAKAGKFKVSFHYQKHDPAQPGNAGEGPPSYVANFDYDRYPRIKGWYAWYRSLDPGQSQVFQGSMALPERYRGETLLLYAVADSTAGDEFQPRHGRIRESDEDNNRSPGVRFELPESGNGATQKVRPPKPLKVKPGGQLFRPGAHERNAPE